MKVSEKIKMLRKEKGWSQGQLAMKLGVHPQHISRYETGNSNPSADALGKLAEVFGVSVDYLLNNDADDSGAYMIKDKQLLKYFEEVDRMNEDDKKIIKGLIESMILKNKVKDLTTERN
jgi:transcriptional regulator with XRE-family HTH domain